MTLTRCDLALATAPFRRRWGLALIALLLIAVACALTAANASLFLFLHARPLPYPNGDRLVWVGLAGRDSRNSVSDNLTLDAWEHVRGRLQTAERSAASVWWRNETLRHEHGSEAVSGTWISPGYFEVFGLKPQLGATFADPALVGRGPRPLLLSAPLWQRLFSSDPGVVGRSVWLNDRPHVVVGVMPAGLRLPGYTGGEQPAYWAPLDPREVPLGDWKSRWFPTYALLRTGSSLEQMQAELDLVTEQLRREFPDQMAHRRLTAHDLKDWVIGANRRHINLLITAAALLSALMLVNLANLLLAHTRGRSAYFGVALALGADRPQALRPVLLEAVLLWAAGVAVSVPLVLGYHRFALHALAEAGVVIPAFDLATFLPTIGAALLLILGLAAGGGRRNLREQTSPGGNAASSRVVAGRSRSWLDGAALFAQTALAVTLVGVCVLLARSIQKQATANRHLPLAALHRAQLVLRETRYPSQEALLRVWHEVKAAVRDHADVTAVALSTYTLTSEQTAAYGMVDAFDTIAAKDSPKTVTRDTGCSDYFATTGIPIVAGRAFTAQDVLGRRSLVIISQQVARRHWPGRDPLGQRLLVHHRTDKWAEIIGVAGDLESPRSNQPMPVLWRSLGSHVPPVQALLFQTRTGQPLPLETLRSVVHGVDPEIAIVEYHDVAAFMRAQRWFAEAIARLGGLLALVAGLVCGFGVFSILNHRVSASLREIAVRKALGASFAHLLVNLVRRDLVWVLAGVPVGLLLSVTGSRQLFELTNLDTLEVVTASAAGTLAVLAGALAGALVPAARALRADPLPLLRSEGVV